MSTIAAALVTSRLEKAAAAASECDATTGALALGAVLPLPSFAAVVTALGLPPGAVTAAVPPPPGDALPRRVLAGVAGAREAAPRYARHVERRDQARRARLVHPQVGARRLQLRAQRRLGYICFTFGPLALSLSCSEIIAVLRCRIRLL